ncbi:MAG: TnsA endonuclease N-terminal domain-containing protein [Peptostreptococcaceae bacterium]|nr:TnsA endonuclease N-terminal domain-containing protein [Peptostreptococcaceae bacterium]
MIINRPAKMTRTTNYGNNYWITESFKLNREIKLYSDLEYSNFLHVEVGDPNIIGFQEQPFSVLIEIDGIIEKTIFDMEVIFSTGEKELWEVKYLSELEGNSKASKRSKHQIEKQQKWCDENGYIYKVRTENDIYLGSEYINNLSYIFHQLKRMDISEAEMNSKVIINKLKEFDRLKISDFVDEETEAIQCLQAVILMIYKGQVKADLFKNELNYNTEVYDVTEKI